MSLSSPGERIHAASGVDEISVSLRVFGDDLDPEYVSRLLGVAPSLVRAKGEVRHSGGREVAERTGLWLLEVEYSPASMLADVIEALLDRFPSDMAVWAELTARYRVDLFCGLFLESWNRGVMLPAALLGRLAARGVDFHLDFYACGDPEARCPKCAP